MTAINTALSCLDYTPIENFNSDYMRTASVTVGVRAFDTLTQTIYPENTGDHAESPSLIGDKGGANMTIHILVQPVNDLPVINAPQAMVMWEDDVLELLNANITVNDVDSIAYRSNNLITIELSPQYGILRYKSSGNGLGLLASAAQVRSGKKGHSLKITGSISMVNAVISAIEYHPTTDFNGLDPILITVDDHIGATVEHVLAIEVRAVNDAPKLSGIRRQVMSKDDTSSSSSSSSVVVAL
jgi:hypothetical protein